MSLTFYYIKDTWGRLITSTRKDGKGTLNAANPRSNNPPLHANIRLHIPASEVSVRNRVRKITFRVVDAPPYGLIVGADYTSRNKESILGFRPDKGLKHSQNAPCILVLDHTPPPLIVASLTDSRAPTALDATHRTAQSHKDMAWEDDST